MHAGRPRTAQKHSSRSHHVPTPDNFSGSGCSNQPRAEPPPRLLLLTLHGDFSEATVSDPGRDPGAAVCAGGQDAARDDAGLLRRIGRGDEDAMAEFYREHGWV